MKRLSAFLLVLAAVSASAQTADLRRDLERMDRRLRVLEAAPEIRVLSRPGMVPQQWTEVPGWRTIELVPAGGTTFETTSSQKTVRVVVRTTGGAGPLSVTNGIGGDGGASPLRVKLGAGLAFDGDGNVVLSMPDYAYFSRGITLGTNAWTNAAGTLRRAPDGFRPQVSDGANWYPVGDLSDAPSDTNAYARKGGAWVPVPTNAAGTGSGFPLTNDVSAGGFSLEDVGALAAGDVLASNGLVVLGDTALRDTVVTGRLVVVGTYYAVSNVVITTNVTIGVSTTFLNKVVYATQEVFQTTIVYTNVVTTNVVYTYVNVGGTWDATNAAWVGIPGLYAPLGGTNLATGSWDFTGALLFGVLTEAGAGSIATNVVSANWTAEERPEPVVPSGGVATVWSTGRWLRSYAPDTSVATLKFARAAGSLTNAAIVPLYFRCGTNRVYFYTNNLLGFSTNGIKTDGSTNLAFAESPPGSTNFYWDLRR